MKSTIKDRGHRFHVCRQDDIVLSNSMPVLQRKAAWVGWGSLKFSRGTQFAPNGGAVEESRNSPSATIEMNYRPDMEVSSLAWIYEERRKSSPRWFKILSVTEGRDCFVFKVRLVERGDDVQRPVTPDTPAPEANDMVPGTPPDWLTL